MSKVTNVKAQLAPDFDYDQLGQTPGAIALTSKGECFVSCPCGCALVVRLAEHQVTREGDHVTVHPSVGIPRVMPDRQDIEADGYHWHGWLREGRWVSC